MVPSQILGLLFLLATVYSSPVPKKLLADDDQYRLPPSIVPTKYTIALTFPETAFTEEGTEFQGNATIDFKVNSAVTEIKLHLSSDFISITKLTVNNLGLDPNRSDYTINSTTEILTIPTEGMSITVGNTYRMKITYNGTISTTDNYGIYKSSYTNAQKEVVYLLATQFQASYARRAFPCFDEPSFKATYDVSVTYPSAGNLGVLFNTEKSEEPELIEDSYTVTFKTTPTISSYLIALIISDFTMTAGTDVVGDTISYAVWSKNGTETSREYAKKVGPQILQQLNEYTGRLYSSDLPKVDQVALPDMSGAMENWGLVTYEEQYLLWNAEDSSTNSKQSIATIISHELAHQWFGNVITCNWWSESFLNEGFATYFEYFTTHKVETTWELDKQFVLDVLHQVLESDGLIEAKALQSEASSPLQVSDKFGIITYKKGGSIIRMLTHIMGEDNFKAGIQQYFKTAEHLYSTSIPSKLWDILQKHVDTEFSLLPEGVTLTIAMKSWVEEPGYPLLTVSLNGNNLKISQKRFLLNGEGEDTKWYVPITYVESANKTKFQDTKPVDWLTPETSEITVTLENNNSWVLLNPLQTGYYRVTYDTNLWTNIAAALQRENFDGIDVLNRAQIVDDLFSLAQANVLSYFDVFKTLEFLRKDTSYYTWVPAFKGFNFILQRVPEGTELRTFIEDQMLNLTDALFSSVSFDEVNDEDQIYTFKQVLAISWACKLGKEDCVNNSITAYNEYVTAGTKPNKNLKSVVYCNALRNSNDVTDYEFLWNLYAATDVSTDKNTILSCLGCSKHEDKLKELLTEAIQENSTIIKTQDSLTAFAAVYSGSAQGTDVVLDFLADNLPGVLKKYPSTSAKRSLIKGVAGKLTNDLQVEKLKTLIESPEDFPDDIRKDLENALIQAQANIKWISENQADLEKFFKGDVGPTPKPGGASTININMALLTVVSIILGTV